MMFTNYVSGPAAEEVLWHGDEPWIEEMRRGAASLWDEETQRAGHG